MLQNIRDNVQGLAAKVIIGIIIVPFAIFGFESLVGGGGDAVVAEINGEKIHDSELRRAVAQQQRQLLARMGADADPAMLDESQLRGPALERLVTQRLMLQGSGELGISISETAVDRELLGLPQFQQDGVFSQDLYLAVLRDQSYSPAYFKELVRSEMIINQLLEGIAQSELTTAGELEQVAALLQQKRSFGYARVAAAPLAEKVSPSDEEIERFYGEHAGEFMQPERVRLEFLELKAEQFSKPVEEEQVRAEYERERAAFQAGTQRHAAHILVEVNSERSAEQALARAQALAEKIGAGDDFATLARENSDDLGSRDAGGDLGFSSGDAFPESFETALAQLAEGEVSAPVRTEAGYHLIKLLEAEEVAPPGFEERRAEIEQRLSQAVAQPALLQVVERVRDMAFNSDSLREPARQLSLTVKDSGWLARNNDDPLFSQPRLVAAAFSDEVLKEGNNSDAIELAPDHFVVLRVAEHQAAAKRPLAEVRSDVVAALQREQGRAQAQRIAGELLQQWQKGVAPEDAAKAEGLTYTQVDGVSRQGEADPELLHVVFALAPPAQGGVRYQVAPLGNGDVVALQLEAVTDGSLDDMTEPERRALTAQLRQLGGRGSFSGYLTALRASADLELK